MANVTLMTFGTTGMDRIGPETRTPALTAYEREVAEYEARAFIRPLQAKSVRWVGWVSLACVAVFLAAVAGLVWKAGVV